VNEKKKGITRRAVLTALPTVMSGCGGNGLREEEAPAQVQFTPVGANGADKHDLTIVSAETQKPIVGAKVWGPFENDFFTNERGEVTFVTSEGAPLEINAPGYLKRETSFSAKRTTISLWPVVAQEEQYFRDLLYYKGELRVLRASSVAVLFSNVSDNRIVDAHAKAASLIERVFDGAIGFRVGSRQGDVVINVSVNHADVEFTKNPMWGGYTSLTVTSGVIKSGVIVYRDIQRAIDLAHHELGHTLGLGHVSASGAWMMDPNNYYLASDFHETEKSAIRFGIARQPRWQPMDNDRDLPGVQIASVGTPHIIGC